MERKTCVFKKDWFVVVKDMPIETRDKMYDAIFNYAFDGIEPDDSLGEKAFFHSCQIAIDRYKEKFDKKSEQGKNAANARWSKEKNAENADGCDRMQTHKTDAAVCKRKKKMQKMQTDAVDAVDAEYEYEYEYENEYEKEEEEKEKSSSKKKKCQSKGFIPPTVDEVQTYIREKEYKFVTADKFVSHYSERKWIVGNEKMKDWRAVIDKCEMREKEKRGLSIPDGVTLGDGEFIKDGIRGYNGKSGFVQVPMDAPPRPSVFHIWVADNKTWYYQRQNLQQ